MDPPGGHGDAMAPGGRIRPRFCAARVARTTPCGVRHKVSKTMRLNKEGGGKSWFAPRLFVDEEGDGDPEQRRRAAATRWRGRGRPCRSVGGDVDG